jgi:opacity protein-like surface antigen
MTPLRSTALAALAAILIAGLAAGPASAQYYDREHTLRFRAGLFEPDGESQYWDDTAGLFTGDASDFEDTLVGFDYRMSLGGEHLALLLSASDYSGEDHRTYLDFVDDTGGEIRHTASLDITSLTAGLVLRFAPHAAVSPYIGAGGGLYSWTLEERGRFIDFGSPGLDLFRSDFQDEGDTFGYYVQAGLDIPLGAGWALFAEGRWHEADDELSGDFEGLGTLDLSGREISAGASWTF